MSAPSKWPLPEAGIRFLTPAFMSETLAEHPLTAGCYPTALGYYPKALNHRMRRQRHDDNLLIYCTEGRGQLSTSDELHTVEPGDVTLLPEGQEHLYEADKRDPWTLYWVHFRGSAADTFIHYLRDGDMGPVLRAGVSPMLTAAFTSLMEVRRTGYSTRSFINASNQLRHLLSQMALAISEQRGRGQRGTELAKVQTYMLEHLHRSLTLEQMAARANMSKFHFSKRYRQMTGYSPVKHFLHMKMEQACTLLDGTDLSVSTIAARLGYDDPLYFSRLFSRIIGRSPRAYRASIR